MDDDADDDTDDYDPNRPIQSETVGLFIAALILLFGVVWYELSPNGRAGEAARSNAFAMEHPWLTDKSVPLPPRPR